MNGAQYLFYLEINIYFDIFLNFVKKKSNRLSLLFDFCFTILQGLFVWPLYHLNHCYLEYYH